MTRREVAQRIDLAVLKPEATRDDVAQGLRASESMASQVARRLALLAGVDRAGIGGQRRFAVLRHRLPVRR